MNNCSNKLYNEMIEQFKCDMSKKQRFYFLLDVLNMEYNNKERLIFIKVLSDI